ncbi:Protein NEDD1 [Merluccius polli]|uniref:Protein NEDD1 n=1 Tax=Merluccius polli TaxID=89951 RepID=A0AA47M3F7_MERPO|nr:Protein NEDD1 [Merluccius polli]
MEEVVRLVSSGDCVKIWDSVSMTTCEQFLPHSATHPVSQVCWSSNNQYLVSASSVGDKLVVSSLKSSPVPVIELAEGKRQTRVCLSSSSQYLLSGGLDHTVNLWDLKSRRLHRSLKDHKEEVTCVSFNSNDTAVASGSTSGDLILHSLTTNLSSKPFGHGANQPIHDLRLSPLKRSLLGSVSDGGTVALWDSNSQKELHVFDGAHKAPGSGLAFSPASDLLFISAGLDKKIICYDTASKIILRVIRVDAPLTAVDFSPDGSGVVVGSTQGKIYHYDLRNPSAPTRVTLAHKTSVTCLRYQSSTKSAKSSKGSSAKRISSKLSSGPTDSAPRSGPAHPSPAPHTGEKKDQNTGGVCVESQAEPPAAVGKFNNNVGRTSLDMFSPAREGHPSLQAAVGGGSVESQSDPLAALGKINSVGRTSLDMFSPAREATGGEVFPRDGESLQVRSRASLDVFSPVRDGTTAGDPSGIPHRKTPLGTPGNRCFSPLSFFQTPPPIREEETLPSTGQPVDSKQNNNNSSSPEAGQMMPTTSPPTNPNQPAPPFFTPEPSLRRANGLQAPLGASFSHNAATPNTAPGSSELSSSVAAQLEGVCAQGGAPLTALQTHFIQNMIHDTLEEFRDACHRDIVNLQVEMIRQFYIQLKEIHGLIEKYSLNDSLLEEIQKLREENRKRFNY